MKKLLTLFALLATLGTQAQPRLVVGIIVDQMRWDYLERYRSRYCEGGFLRMMNEGYNCTRCMINYLPAVTAVGHTCVYTGSVPAYTGIVSNSFYVNGKRTYAAYDEMQSTVGSTSAAGRMSPHNMMVTTMTDELRMATNFRSKVIGVALKDRAAILPAGHAANAAYWLDNSPNDKFISSTYYMRDLPQWVKDFNARNLPAEYMKRDWPAKMMYPEDTYVQSHPRDKRIEHTVGDEIRNSPWGATLTLDMARAAVEGENLGADEFADFLAISISSTDAIGHRVGCNSQYVEDAYLWLDRDLESFFNYLDKKVGKGQWTAFLTADHAGSHNPQFRKDHNLPANVWESTEIVKSLNAKLQEQTGVKGNLVMGIDNFKLMINEGLVRHTGIDMKRVCDIVCDELRRHPSVQYAFWVDEMPDYLPEPLRTMTRNGYFPGRTGQIQIVPVGGVMEAFRYGIQQNMKGASHMLWGPDDTHIPLLFMGYGVPQGENNHTVHITDIAATIASVLHTALPSGCVGEPIF